MTSDALRTTYRLIADLLLHPDDRRTTRAEARAICADLGDVVGTALTMFVDNDGAWTADEYVRVLELAPPCPLYLGTYLFDEPTTCRGVGTSGRNAYMLELGGIYRHFGFELSSKELPDFLPAIVDFCGITLERRDADGIGLRRRLLERFIVPALPEMVEALGKYASIYSGLIASLHVAVVNDLEHIETGKPWMPPIATQNEHEVQLAVLSSQDADVVAAHAARREEGRS